MKQVIVVTNPELGWDCVVGVFDIKLLEEVETRFKDNVVRVATVDKNLYYYE